MAPSLELKRPDVEDTPQRVQSIDQGAIGKEIDDRGIDDALAFTAQHHVDHITPEEDRRILRKIDRTLLPIVSFLLIDSHLTAY